MSEIFFFLRWWLAASLAGLAAVPLAARLLPGLPDRGYAFARALGLLVTGYILWMLTSLGWLRNDASGWLLAFGLLVALGAWAARKSGWDDLRTWLMEHRNLVLGYEALFLLAFAGWAIVRAHNPPLTSAGGEKWMEYAFLNAIQRSPTFPPLDPWLAGYAISYYYFGYVIMAGLSTVTGVPLSHGFNLGIGLLFALCALAATGMTLNLIALASREPRPGEDRSRPVPTLARHFLPALLGAVMVLGVGNFEGVWETLHTRGWGSTRFWNWLDVHNLSAAPVTGQWAPDSFFWWWRASRTLNDRNWIACGAEYDLLWDTSACPHVEVIDEFPFFSFLLGDMHPHVLALPFAFLAMATALSLCSAPSGARLPRDRLVLAALVLGGLSFLNTWDFPIYLFLVAMAHAIGSARLLGWGAATWRETGTLVMALAFGGVVLYLPFYLGFSSQAGGLLPNLMFPTRWQQFLTMFGPLLIPLAIFLGYLLAIWRKAMRPSLFAGTTLGSVVGLLALSLALGALLLRVPALRAQVEALVAPHGLNDAIPLVLRNRIVHVWTGLLLAVIVGAVVALLAARRSSELAAVDVPIDSPAVAFALVLILTAALLVLGPEFVYLRDQFGTRMNTVFKFYYQAWALWGVAAAFGVWYVWRLASRIGRWVTGLAVGVAIGLGLVYPVLALPTRIREFGSPVGPTLDSSAEYIGRNPEDAEGIRWLAAHVSSDSIILEAVGSSYSEYGRVSAFTGVPTVLGWPGHEVQWRGGATEIGSRESDVQAIYSLPDWTATAALLDRYGVDYVYIGPMERARYSQAVGDKFAQHLPAVFSNSEVSVYHWVAASR